jgi:hypothetical protein
MFFPNVIYDFKLFDSRKYSNDENVAFGAFRIQGYADFLSLDTAQDSYRLNLLRF